MADGMERLLNNPELRTRLVEQGKKVARENYSLAAFRRKLKQFYKDVRLLTAVN